MGVSYHTVHVLQTILTGTYLQTDYYDQKSRPNERPTVPFDTPEDTHRLLDSVPVMSHAEAV